MKKATGFTLIDLLVVMAILGMLAALVGPALFGNLSKGQRTTAASQISNLEAALDTYRLDVGSYPDSLRGLVENDSGSPRGYRGVVLSGLLALLSTSRDLPCWNCLLSWPSSCWPHRLSYQVSRAGKATF